jgi:hypothetical protein
VGVTAFLHLGRTLPPLLIYGHFRIERITEVVEKFIRCGDYSQGIGRI